MVCSVWLAYLWCFGVVFGFGCWCFGGGLAVCLCLVFFACALGFCLLC